MHARHHVSTKVALFSADLERVMVMYYPKPDIYGLPGGHIDRGEEPDTALARELEEELGVTVANIRRNDFFFLHRIILGYTAIVPNDFETFPPHPTKEHGVWFTKDQIMNAVPTLSEAYRQFILEHWPTTTQA